MPVTNSVSVKRETLNLRIKPAERDLIDRAAKALIDQRIIMADPEAYQKFLARLVWLLRRMLRCAKPCRRLHHGNRRNDLCPLSHSTPNMYFPYSVTARSLWTTG
jgi:hypothetical protein